MGQSRGYYGSMQNARDNLADIMVPCKMHETILRTLWFHAKCMGQSRRQFDSMQNAWDNFVEMVGIVVFTKIDLGL